MIQLETFLSSQFKSITRRWIEFKYVITALLVSASLQVITLLLLLFASSLLILSKFKHQRNYNDLNREATHRPHNYPSLKPDGQMKVMMVDLLRLFFPNPEKTHRHLPPLLPSSLISSFLSSTSFPLLPPFLILLLLAPSLITFFSY